MPSFILLNGAHYYAFKAEKKDGVLSFTFAHSLAADIADFSPDIYKTIAKCLAKYALAPLPLEESLL